MPVVRGYNISVGYKEESTEGTIPDGTEGNPITYDYFGHITGLTPTINPNPIEVRPIGVRYPITILKGRREVNLSIDAHILNNTVLKYFLNNITKTITVWERLNDLNASIMYTGLRGNRLRLRGEVGAPLAVTAEFYGMDAGTTAPTYASLPSVVAADPMHFPDQNVTIGGSQLSGRVQSFECEINNNVEKIYLLGDVVSSTSVEKTIEVSGTITITLESLSDLADVLNLATKNNLVITLGKDQSNATNTLTISNIKWGSFPKPVSVGNIITVSLPFTSFGAIPTLSP